MQSPNSIWHNLASSNSKGSPVMPTPALDQPRVEIEGRLGAQEPDEARELALLAQFMRHDSVVSLAGAIAERLGGPMRGGDLIARAGLCANRRDN